MAARLRRHLTFANVMSVIAVFIALGGAAYAVTKAPKNSVVSSSIRNGQVKKKDLGKDAVTGAKVKESTLGQVPSAASAATATRADSAASADSAAVADISAKRVESFGMPTTDPAISQSGEGQHLLASAGGVEVRASCFLSGGSDPQVILSVKTPVDARLYSTRALETSGDDVTEQNEQSRKTLLAGASYTVNEAYEPLPGTVSVDATSIYRSASQVLVITSHVEARKPANTCDVVGAVTRAN